MPEQTVSVVVQIPEALYLRLQDFVSHAAETYTQDDVFADALGFWLSAQGALAGTEQDTDDY